MVFLLGLSVVLPSETGYPTKEVSSTDKFLTPNKKRPRGDAVNDMEGALVLNAKQAAKAILVSLVNKMLCDSLYLDRVDTRAVK